MFGLCFMLPTVHSHSPTVHSRHTLRLFTLTNSPTVHTHKLSDCHSHSPTVHSPTPTDQFHSSLTPLPLIYDRLAAAALVVQVQPLECLADLALQSRSRPTLPSQPPPSDRPASRARTARRRGRPRSAASPMRAQTRAAQPALLCRFACATTLPSQPSLDLHLRLRVRLRLRHLHRPRRPHLLHPPRRLQVRPCRRAQRSYIRRLGIVMMALEEIKLRCQGEEPESDERGGGTTIDGDVGGSVSDDLFGLFGEVVKAYTATGRSQGG